MKQYKYIFIVSLHKFEIDIKVLSCPIKKIKT